MADNKATKAWVDKKVKESQLKYDEFMKHMEKEFNQQDNRGFIEIIREDIFKIEIPSYGHGSALARAPKFGVKHIRN